MALHINYLKNLTYTLFTIVIIKSGSCCPCEFNDNPQKSHLKPLKTPKLQTFFGGYQTRPSTTNDFETLPILGSLLVIITSGSCCPCTEHDNHKIEISIWKSIILVVFFWRQNQFPSLFFVKLHGANSSSHTLQTSIRSV